MSSIYTAIEALKEGKIILYPTDTIWGLGCDATNEEACQRINKIKHRPESKSFIVLVDSFRMLERYIPEFHEICYDLVDLATKPLTIIYPAAKGLAPSVSANDGSVGIRLTTDPVCIKLIQHLKRPIVSTSANLSEDSIARDFSEIHPEIKKNVDAIVEERLTEKCTTPSQIIKIDLNGGVTVIRK